MVIAGGANPEPLNDMWALDLSGQPTWEPLSPLGGTLPTPGIDSGDYWPLRDQIVMFGGAYEDHLRLNETWGLTWGLHTTAPDSVAVLSISPKAIASGRFVSLTLDGLNLPEGLMAELRPIAGSPILPRSVSVAKNGTQATIRFLLTNAPLGPAALVLTLPGGGNLGTPLELNIVEDRPHHDWVRIVGPTQMRSGVEKVFTILAGNDGVSDVVGVPLLIAGIPTCASVRVLTPVEPLTTGEAFLDSLSDVVPTDSEQIVALLLSHLRPSVPTQVSIGVTVPCDTAFTLTARLFMPMVDAPGTLSAPGLGSKGTIYSEGCSDEDVLPCALKEIGLGVIGDAIGSAAEDIADLIPDRGLCGKAWADAITSTSMELYSVMSEGGGGGALLYSLPKLTGHSLKLAASLAQCEGLTHVTNSVRSVVKTTIKVTEKLAKAFSYIDIAPCFVTGAGCHSELYTTDQLLARIRNSVDPNAKTGPVGVTDAHIIGPTQNLAYLVEFENLPQATAPAASVTVSDVLDSTLFDLASFRFGPITLAGQRFDVPAVGDNFVLTRDLRPMQPVLLGITGEFNRITGQVFWTFASFDPLTCAPITDPDLGFLPPNLIRPQGEASVSFVVAMAPNLPDGHRIDNVARVVFDTNGALLTHIWSNLLDRQKPSARVQSLPPVIHDTAFPVSWSATDAGAGIADVNVYVSENSGPFVGWLIGAKTDTATYVGNFGNTYSFIALGRDEAGNRQDQPATPDATTSIEQTTAAQTATVVRSESNSGGVLIQWYIGLSNDEWTILRKSETNQWEELASLRPDEAGFILYEDSAIPPGVKYAYCVHRSDASELSGLVWMESARLHLSLRGAISNPVDGAVSIHFDLPDDQPSRLDLIDISGRRIRTRSVGSLGAGSHVVDIAGESHVRPGVYFVRLGHAGQVLTKRIVVVSH